MRLAPGRDKVSPMTKTALAAIAVAIGLVLAGCGGATNPQQSRSGVALSAGPSSTKLVASYGNVIASFLPTWMAKEAGIYQKNGLDVDLRLIDSAKGIPALLSGETQIADIGGSQILSAAVNGADLVLLS